MIHFEGNLIIIGGCKEDNNDLSNNIDYPILEIIELENIVKGLPNNQIKDN